MKPAFILYLLLFSMAAARAQGYEEIEGKILNEATKEPIQYANIYNKTLQKGTISNADGYFRVPVTGSKDSVFAIFIGYQTQPIVIQPGRNFYSIYLHESSQLLGEVVVTPKDNSYLVDLIMHCRKHSSSYKASAKAYFELKTFKDDTQMELVEGYYNASILGYDLEGLTLKAGRLALQPYRDRLFASMESSKAITRMKVWAENQYFPDSPLSLSKSVIKRKYDLYLDKKYLDDDADSIYVINYDPVDTSGTYFSGQLWINASDRTILKITLNCPHARVHPFLPLFDIDSISNVNLMITRTFAAQQGEMAFNHIDFTYVVDYKSRMKEENALAYSVKSEAILYAYDFDDPFFVPLTDLADSTYSDYRRINATPYNDFFWKYNDEYRLKDDNNANELFYSNDRSITNQTLFTSNKVLKKGLFEQPYVQWSTDRVFLHPATLDSIEDPGLSEIKTDKYLLEVKYYMDINTYADSTDILTAIIFDPYESFYHLPIDNKTHCFINIYFDLCEIERRKLEAQLRSMPVDEDQYREVYNAFVNRIDRQRYQYLKSVDRGTNEQEMIKWNDIVFKELGINNIALFKPFEGN